MAEGLIRAEAASRGESGIQVASAGTWVTPDLSPMALAIDVMAERGIDISGVRSREVTAELIAASDLVLAMTNSQRQALEAEFPEARGKVWLMSALAGGSYDIADPAGGDRADFEATASELARLIRIGWPIIAGRGEVSAPAGT